MRDFLPPRSALAEVVWLRILRLR